MDLYNTSFNQPKMVEHNKILESQKNALIEVIVISILSLVLTFGVFFFIGIDIFIALLFHGGTRSIPLVAMFLLIIGFAIERIIFAAKRYKAIERKNYVITDGRIMQKGLRGTVTHDIIKTKAYVRYAGGEVVAIMSKGQSISVVEGSNVHLIKMKINHFGEKDSYAICVK